MGFVREVRWAPIGKCFNLKHSKASKQSRGVAARSSPLSLPWRRLSMGLKRCSSSSWTVSSGHSPLSFGSYLGHTKFSVYTVFKLFQIASNCFELFRDHAVRLATGRCLWICLIWHGQQPVQLHSITFDHLRSSLPLKRIHLDQFSGTI